MPTEFNKTLGRLIEEKSARLAEAITERHYQLKPELAARYGEKGRVKCLQDAAFHLSYLSESIAASRPALFGNYVAWAKVMLAGRGIPAEDLADNLRVIRASLQSHLPPQESAVACDYVDAGLEQVKQSPSELPPIINPAEPLADLAGKYLSALLRGERHAASKLVLDAAESGVKIKDIYLFVFQRVQHEIGRLWQINELSVAQEHYCTAATQMIMSQLYPYIFTSEKNGRTMIATCVEGDYHEIGARMVADFFEMAGWDTMYLGANVPTSGILQTLAERKIDLLVVSATMTFHVRAVRELIKVIRSSEAARNVKIMVGGYPFNVEPELWREIGADAYSANADEAIAVAEQLVS
jgi:methanogenic corrinoid protein MtbC1